jgi:hypothetical protein
MKKYYVGGFESSMSMSEAALILGLRRTSSIKKITEKHRKLIIANHPDRGGSPLFAAKVIGLFSCFVLLLDCCFFDEHTFFQINQAKEMLLKDVRLSQFVNILYIYIQDYSSGEC